MLEREYKMCVKAIRNLGIRVADDYNVEELSSWDSKTLGMCCYSRKTIYVSISGMTEVDILSTLCHEIIHTNRLCHNHGKAFKMYAAIVNEYFRRTYPKFACGYHEANIDNCEYIKNQYYEAKYVIYATPMKQLAQHNNKRCKIWSRINECAQAKLPCEYDIKRGDGFSLIALEKVENGYVYYDRRTSERKFVKNLDVLAEI